MLNLTQFQPYILVFLLFIGILIGLFYEVLNLIFHLFKRNIIIRALLDTIFVFTAFIVFFASNLYCNFGEFRLYTIFVYIAGFILTRVSLGFLLANFYNLVYTKIVGKERQKCQKRN